ncbi:MAG: hypothetical protein ACREX9_22625 [Gammaproteobacteria bacterium]
MSDFQPQRFELAPEFLDGCPMQVTLAATQVGQAILDTADATA